MTSHVGFQQNSEINNNDDPKFARNQQDILQVEPGKPGAEVSKKKTISQRKNLPIECAQGDQPLRCPNRVV